MKTNADKDIIKKVLEVWDKRPNFFAKDFCLRVPVLNAYVKDKAIEYKIGGSWMKEDGYGFSFEAAPDKYRIASETTVVELNGEKFEIDIARAKEMGLIKKVS